MIRVLIVDDKPEGLYLLRSLLQGNGCFVEEARHGAEALARARQAPPDLIVSDLLMPVMDGYTLLRHWKTDERLRRIPFLVYTATYTEPQDEQLALELGADAFILKPSEPAAFMARLREVLQQAESGTLAVHRPAGVAESLVLEEYSQTLVRKLEEKAMQLQEANRILQADLARQRQADERIREQAALLDNASDAILSADLELRIRYWSKGAERLYGWNETEVRGRPLREALGADAADCAAAAARARETGAWSGEVRHATKAGTELLTLSRWTLVRDDQGQPRLILVINTDVTEKRQLEARFLRAQRLESIGALASGIAHDLNNVLAPIIMGAPLLRSTAQDDTARHLLAMIETSAQRGASIVRQVLTFARGTEGQRVSIASRHLIHDMVKMAEETFPKNIEIAEETAADVGAIEADVTQLHQALLNLCVNARDAMPEGGRLTLAAESATIDGAAAAKLPGAKAGAYVRLRVADTGTGIAPEVQERIFEPFFTTKPQGKGTGLGLATVLGIVKSHGGFIRVDSRVGQGTTFELYLPATAAAPASPAGGSLTPWPRSHGETVLLVDDEAAVCEVARQALEEAGYHVIIAHAGAAAIRSFRAAHGEVRLVVTDMMMPEMDGLSLVAALRVVDPAVRIVGITGVADAAAMQRLQALELAAMLAKPFTIGQLLTTVRAALAPSGKAKAEAS